MNMLSVLESLLASGLSKTFDNNNCGVNWALRRKGTREATAVGFGGGGVVVLE